MSLATQISALASRIGQEMKLKVASSDSRLTDARVPMAISVSYAKIATDMTSRQAISSFNVDWSTGGIFTKTLTANTTLTFSNVQLNKVITLVISGAFTLTLPITAAYIQGTYSTSKTNKIQIHCTNATSGSEEYWAVITTN
ncbi:MAG TPA: hypothetical protein DCO83_10700 [Mucilaginibacter sp.]|nr:hypothetical protein [Mucilaginibacter sp.]